MIELEVSDPGEAPAQLRERLERAGYLYVRALIAQPRIEAVAQRVRSVAERLGLLDAARPPVTSRDPAFIALQRELLPGAEVAQLAADGGLRAVLAAALDAPPQRRFADVCRVGSPRRHASPDGCDPTTPPHQDGHYLKTPDASFLITWIPLVDCPLELGPLAVLPGSQASGLLPHVYRPSSASEEAVLDEEAEPRFASSAMRRGDVLCFTSLTVHRALPNRTADTARLSIDLRWSR